MKFSKSTTIYLCVLGIAACSSGLTFFLCGRQLVGGLMLIPALVPMFLMEANKLW